VIDHVDHIALDHDHDYHDLDHHNDFFHDVMNDNHHGDQYVMMMNDVDQSLDELYHIMSSPLHKIILDK
jgi:hypothetical protein